MSIRDIIRNHKGRAGSGGSWEVIALDSDPFVGREFALRHYGTTMLIWRESQRNGIELIDYSIGHGSVSDQGGMNTAFKVLGLPYRFDRNQRGGGPRITDISDRVEAYRAETGRDLLDDLVRCA